jgi:hypothetical protein
MSCGCQAAKYAASEPEPALEVVLTPGACDNGDALGIAVGAFILGSIATVVFINISGETSVRGLAKKTHQYARGAYHVARKSYGK